MAYRVEITPAAQRDLKKLSAVATERLSKPILSLQENPRPAGSKKLQGDKTAWRIRVGSLRVVYQVLGEQQVVVILKVARRNEATYRR